MFYFLNKFLCVCVWGGGGGISRLCHNREKMENYPRKKISMFTVVYLNMYFQAFLCRQTEDSSYNPVHLTSVHNPSVYEERMRIQKAGGQVKYVCVCVWGYICLCNTMHPISTKFENAILKGLGRNWGQCLFTKIIWPEILIEFLQKVIQKCTNHFEKDWTINRAKITHKSLYL